MTEETPQSPKIFISIDKEWTTRVQQTVTLHYSIINATELRTEVCSPGTAGILEDGEATDVACFGPDYHGTDSNLVERQEKLNDFGGRSFHVWARNGLGTTHRYVSLNLLQPIGYHGASTPGPVYRSEINALRGFLEDVEERLTRPQPAPLPPGCIRNNEALNRFSNSTYLRDGLTNDLLTRMRDVVIFRDGYSLPIAGRYEVKLDGDSNRNYLTARPQTLCFHDPASPNPSTGVYGFTTRNWVGTCYRAYPPNPPIPPAADAYTLLHELYHYGVSEGQIGFPEEEEAKARVIAAHCFP